MKKPSPIDPNSNPQRRDEVPIGVVQHLAEKLSGRPEVPIKRHAHNLSRARGAGTQAVHGPLRRLLGIVWFGLDLYIDLTGRRIKVPKQSWTKPPLQIEVV